MKIFLHINRYKKEQGFRSRGGVGTPACPTETNLRNVLFFPLAVWLLLSFCFSCTDLVPTREVRLIDSLNGWSYAYRYRNLDSSYKYAQLAYNRVKLYKSGKAEALNNLGFCAFMNMDFETAEDLFQQVYHQTTNELELLIADIGLMKIYQRTSTNKEFFDYRNNALRRMKRIREDSDLFVDRHEKRRLDYAMTEFHIVSTIYYFYLKQREEALASFRQIREDEVAQDTNQLLYYHYIRGAASMMKVTKLHDRRLSEFDELFHTWEVASQGQHPYFEGNALQGLADLMGTPAKFEFFKRSRQHVLDRFGFPVDTLLPLRLGQLALQKFQSYKDLYQIAGTYVTIGKYLNAHGCYAQALDTLTRALDCVNYHHRFYYHTAADSLDRLMPYAEGDTTYTGVPWIREEGVKTVPEWISRIREQLSVSYIGLGKKQASDYNRNSYLDILNFTRQDKELESRLQSLETDSRQMTWILSMVLIGFLLLMILWWFVNKRSRLRNQLDVERLQQILFLCKDITSSIPMDVDFIQQGIDRLFGTGKLKLETNEADGQVVLQPLRKLSRDEQALVSVLQPYIKWASDNEQMIEALSDERLQLEKQRYIYEQHIAGNKRQNLVKKACMAIVHGIHPYIDRMLNEVCKLVEKGYLQDTTIKREKYQYIDELVTTINEYNDILALWIKMKQGSINLNIETFSLQSLFDLLSKGRRAFDMKQQTLVVEPTSALVKADRALTFFMLNTLAENARKYTQEGGEIRISAAMEADYVEISVADNGQGISQEDIAYMFGEKVYDSSLIGLKHAADPENLKANKGHGFGLMNCKGIIEKYKKTNDLFRVCMFNVESELGKGSRFYFRLPLGVRKMMGLVVMGFLWPLLLGSCQADLPDRHVWLEEGSVEPVRDSLGVDSVYESYFRQASLWADSAYMANVNGRYERALECIDRSMDLLNEHYRRYARPKHAKRFMKLYAETAPAEIRWWKDYVDTDYHIILDIRNEAAVAFLALKQLEAYTYNNAAYTDLYKLQGEDQTLEADCRLLERSNTNKIVGIILCFILLFISLIGYYFLYLRKRLQNRLNLEQVLEINQKVYAASLPHPEEGISVEALEREENALKEIPQHIVDESFESVNELLAINCLGLAVYNERTHALEYASCPGNEMPEMVKECFERKQPVARQWARALPLQVEVGGDFQYVGVLYLERREDTEQETDALFFELIARYISIVVFNAVVKLASQYRDIESAHEEARRASWEDSMLHVQNMVLDNCLSTIKHETIYYPNKIKQIIDRLNTQTLSAEEERESVDVIRELIDYYKEIFVILSSCAARQLEEVTFRRSTLAVSDLLEGARKYFDKKTRKWTVKPTLLLDETSLRVVGDRNQLGFLFENLIDEALTVVEEGNLLLQVQEEEEFVRFRFTDTRRSKSVEALNQLFYPHLSRMKVGEEGVLMGTEYLVCKQIIRDHDEFAGRRGCRINAEPATEGGFTVYFTLPRRK